MHFLADNLGITRKSATPVGVPKNNDGVTAGNAALGRKDEPSIGGLDAERREIVVANPAEQAVVGFVVHREPTERYPISEDVTKGARLIAQIPVSGIGEAIGAGDGGLLQCEHRNLLGMWHGKRPKQKTVDDAENGGVCGHAESEGHNSDDGKAGIVRKRPQCKANVFCKIAHGWTFSVRPKFRGSLNAFAYGTVSSLPSCD